MVTRLPQLDASLFVTDGGLETTLVYEHGLDLPDFAAFPLLDNADGREQLRRYYAPYFALAQLHGVGIIVDTPTWRANSDWATRAGYSDERTAELNRFCVGFVRSVAEEWPAVQALVNGTIGPRGDGYVVGSMMSATSAADYHRPQIKAFADGGADLVGALTITYADEAVGVANAAAELGVNCVISFTVETDGRLPSGMTLEDAIETVDQQTSSSPAYYMVNCAHPTHLENAVQSNGPWQQRWKGVRANASRLSHAELDVAEVLDSGDISELADGFRWLRSSLPDLRVVGGCCGTNHEHVGAIAAVLA